MKVPGEVLDELIATVANRVSDELRIAFSSNKLESYLIKMDMTDILMRYSVDSGYDTLPSGKILIIGDSQVKADKILGCLKELGISKDRIEMRLGYEEAIRYPYKKLQYNPSYRLVLIGPIPHSIAGKEDASSIITLLEREVGYPKIIRLVSGYELKITKTSLIEAVEREIKNGYLEVAA